MPTSPVEGECPARALLGLPRWPLASLASAAANATILQAPFLKEYGMREMDVADLDGYVIRFGEDVPS